MSSLKGNNNDGYKFQKLVVAFGIILFVIKFIAWYITDSLSILSDMLESIINITTGFVGLYSLYLAARPKDKKFPYGRGKVEFISAGIEGGLVGITGLFILYEALMHFWHPQQINSVDIGIYLVAFTSLINYILGYYAIKKGKKNHSMTLVASGKHLQTDTYSTLGIILGLIAIYFTDIYWLDSLVALIFGLIILYTSYTILNESISGILDQADQKLLNETIDVIQKNRRLNWIDIHNFRITKYGSILHFDCHMTLPRFLNISQGHDEISHLEKTISNHFEQKVELFVHLDDCNKFSCQLCRNSDCKIRELPFQKQLCWTTDVVCNNKRHRLDYSESLA